MWAVIFHFDVFCVSDWNNVCFTGIYRYLIVFVWKTAGKMPSKPVSILVLAEIFSAYFYLGVRGYEIKKNKQYTCIWRSIQMEKMDHDREKGVLVWYSNETLQDMTLILICLMNAEKFAENKIVVKFWFSGNLHKWSPLNMRYFLQQPVFEFTDVQFYYEFFKLHLPSWKFCPSAIMALGKRLICISFYQILGQVQ